MNQSLLILSILIQISSVSAAYNLYKTPDGTKVRWDKATVELVLDPSLGALGPINEVRDTLQKAVTMWEIDGDIPVHFELAHGDCRAIENDENNCIFACTEIADCPRDEKDKGAGTFLSVSTETGAIQDVDIVFNAIDWDFDDHGHGSSALDLTAVAVHELGHALGIDHSTEQAAAMYPSIEGGTEARSALHSDDIDAAVSLYEGFQPGIEAAYGCSVAGPGVDSNPSFLLGFAALWFAYIIRRGRRETR